MQMDYSCQIPSRKIYSGRFRFEKKLKTGKNWGKTKERKKGRKEEKGKKLREKGRK